MTLMNILRQSEQSMGGGRSLSLLYREEKMTSYILDKIFLEFFFGIL